MSFKKKHSNASQQTFSELYVNNNKNNNTLTIK